MSEESWFVRDKERIRGPFSHDQLLKMHQRGQLARFHDISTDRKSWVKAVTLLDPIAQAPSLPDDDLPPAWSDSTQDTVMIPALSEEAWPQMTDDLDLTGGGSRSKSRRRSRWAIAIAAPCVTTAAVLTYLVFHETRPPDGPNPPGGGGVILSLDDAEKRDGAVGIVVAGIEQTPSEGRPGEMIRLSTGTCFSISEEGVLVTNRHLVEVHQQIAEAQDPDERRSIALKSLREGDAGAMAPRQGIVLGDFEPRLWVYLVGKNNRPRRYLAEVKHLGDDSEPDLAILKVQATAKEPARFPFFRLSGDAKSPEVGDELVSLGFPDLPPEAASKEEGPEGFLAKRRVSGVEPLFKERTSPSEGMGKVTGIYADKWPKFSMIHHDADLNRMSSGGPLVNRAGLVVGINTRGPKNGASPRAISVARLREIISGWVPEAVFEP